MWKIASGIWCGFGGSVDRFIPQGYGDLLSTEEAIAKAGKVKGLDGIEFDSGSINEKNFDSVKKALKENNLCATSISIEPIGPKWKYGGFTSYDQRRREEAIQLGKKVIDMAKELNCNVVGMWLAQDGFDYPFQVNYGEVWQREIKGIKEVAEYGKEMNMKVAIEYKLKEPRKYILISNVGKALLAIKEINLDNLGVTLDFGHALISKENPGESAFLLSRYNKLFNVHINDAYREWDDDMAVGTINFWETLEFLSCLKEVDYKGHIVLDQFPFREDPIEAATLSIKNIQALTKLLEKMDFEEIKKAQRNMDVVAVQNILRESIF